MEDFLLISLILTISSLLWVRLSRIHRPKYSRTRELQWMVGKRPIEVKNARASNLYFPERLS